MELVKPERYTNAAYLAFVTAQRCLLEGRYCVGGIDPHHLSGRGGRGSDPATGGSDLTTVPLCRYHHQIITAIGPHTFAQNHGIDLWREAFKLLHRYVLSTGALLYDDTIDDPFIGDTGETA